MRVPWTARRSNQSILKEISPGISLEGMMLKLKLQYYGHLMRRVDSLEKTLMLGGIGGRRRRDDRGWDGWMLPPPTTSYPSRLSQSTRLSSLCYVATSHQLSVLHMIMYLFPGYSLNLSHFLLPLMCPSVCSLCLSLQREIVCVCCCCLFTKLCLTRLQTHGL